MKLTDNDYLIRDTFKNNEVYMFYASVKSDRFFCLAFRGRQVSQVFQR